MILLLGVVLIDFASCITPVADTNNPRHGYLARNESFKFDFNCTGWNIPKCNAAKADLAELGELIADELLFRVPVMVCAKLTNVPWPPSGLTHRSYYANTTMRSMYSKSIVKHSPST